MPATKPVIDGTAITQLGKVIASYGPALDRARENLDDELSGWPTSTPGASHPTAGTMPAGKLEHRELAGLVFERPMAGDLERDGADPFTATRADASSRHELGHLPTTKTTTVEKAAQLAVDEGITDEALNALLDIDADVETIRAASERLGHRLRKYGYIVTRPNGTAPDGIHCTQHLKLGLFFKIARHGLCRWCDDFRAEFHRVPSTVLLQTKHEGTTITHAMKVKDHPARRVTRTGKKKAAPMPTHQCARPDCEQQIPIDRWVCPADWASIPADIISTFAVTPTHAKTAALEHWAVTASSSAA